MELQKLEIRYQELAMDVKKHHDVLAAVQSLEYDAAREQAYEREEADKQVQLTSEAPKTKVLLFKPDLVSELKHEPWFLLAAHVAKQSAKGE